MSAKLCYGTCFVQASSTSSQPSVDSCRELLRATPAITAFRRALYGAAPADSRGWLGALGVIARHPGTRPGRVAELLHVDFSVASRAIATLEELGYVQREVDPDDRRASVLEATEEGLAWLREFATGFATSLSAALDGWSDEDVAALTDLLRRFDQSLEGFQP